MALQDDSWRLHSVLKATAKQDHPFSRFSTGSEQTLLEKAGGVDGLHSELKKWNRAYYNSANMRLAVVGRESLEELEALVTASGGSVLFLLATCLLGSWDRPGRPTRLRQECGSRPCAIYALTITVPFTSSQSITRE